MLGSPAIDRLVEQALAANLTLDAARARLASARALLDAERGLRAPSIDASAGAARQAGAGATGANTGGTAPAGGASGSTGSSGSGFSGAAYTVFTAGASIRYDVDAFGRTDRLVEGAQARAIGEAARLQAAWLSVAGNVVASALELAVVQALIDTREALVESQRERLSLLCAQYRAGELARADVLAARTDVSVLQAALPPLRLRGVRAQHRLAELLGRAPTGIEAVEIDLDSLKLPDVVPIALPSTLVRERPDIVAAEAALAAANANIGVATADLYPRITLDASLGRGVLDAGGTTLWGTSWGLGAGLLAPIFQGGRLSALRDVAIADYRQRLADYRATVSGALREVADGLRALELNGTAVAAQRVALANARESVALSNLRLREGVSSVIDVLAVERRYQETLIASIETVGQRMQDAAALFAALGRSPMPQHELADARIDELLAATEDALERGIAPTTLAPR